MPRPGATVLIDANGMIEAHKKGCWAALSARYRVETVEKCLEETQTGFQLRRPEERIDPIALRASLAAVHIVTLRQLAAIDVLDGPILDDGEKALWAHALQRDDAWILCGPDRASMTFGHVQKRRDRLVSLGALLDAIGHRARPPLASQYEKAWLEKLLSDLLLGVR